MPNFQVAQKLCMEVTFPRVAHSILKCPSASRAPPFTVKMELAAVTCISKSHHVAFLRLPNRDSDGFHRWAFYDSMSKTDKGHKVPRLLEVPGLARFLELHDSKHLIIMGDGSNEVAYAEHLEKHAFMSFYVRQS